ncbi:MAG: TIGR01777 family protein [Nitrospinae bacterium]|nr:TIGR01777 family protein [Nitrospinota bacterium]
MKILITGATGFVGNTLLPLLVEKGHEIIVLTRDSKTAQVRLPVVCKIIEWNNISTLKDESIEAVVNLCGENVASGRWTAKRKQAIYDSRVLSTRNLIDYFRNSSHLIKCWVSASAIGVYENSIVPDESSPSGQGFLAKVVKDWEEETFRAKDLNIRTIALRIGMVLGFDGGAMEKLLPLFKLGLGGNISNGNQWMSWIHVRDLAGLIAEAIENPSYEGAINAVSPNSITNRDFTSTLAATLNRPALFPVPAWVFKLLLGEMSQILINSQKVSSDRAKKLGYKFIYPKLEGALKIICSQPGHTLLIEQWVPQPIDKIFEFFTDPQNLETLTPNFLHFKILRSTSSPIQEGTFLDYSLKIRGIPVHWQSKITECIPGVRFSDEQTKGPYKFWHHTHEFFEKNGGTIIRDRILYKLPGWIPGDIIAHWFIRKDLEKIFLYRREVVEKLFHSKEEN